MIAGENCPDAELNSLKWDYKNYMKKSEENIAQHHDYCMERFGAEYTGSA